MWLCEPASVAVPLTVTFVVAPATDCNNTTPPEVAVSANVIVGLVTEATDAAADDGLEYPVTNDVVGPVVGVEAVEAPVA